MGVVLGESFTTGAETFCGRPAVDTPPEDFSRAAMPSPVLLTSVASDGTPVCTKLVNEALSCRKTNDELYALPDMLQAMPATAITPAGVSCASPMSTCSPWGQSSR